MHRVLGGYKPVLAICLFCAIILNLFYYRSIFYEYYIAYKLRNEHIVVSFTTTPHRIEQIYPMLQTILAQRGPIKAIYLSIPHIFERDNLEYSIPQFISEEPRITILRTKDYGPGTKLLGVLEQVNLPDNALIVTVDDDAYYPKNMVLHLAYAAINNPNRAFGLRGANIDYTADGRVDRSTLIGQTVVTKSGAIVNVLQGYSGVVYRKKFFDNPEILFAMRDAPHECKVSDDLYLSYFLEYSNVRKMVLNNKYMNACKVKWKNDISVNDHALHRIAKDHAQKIQICLDYLHTVMPLEHF